MGGFSKIAQLTVKMLRYYLRCGRIHPAKNPDSGYRYYETKRLVPVSKIRTYLNMGFSTAAIRKMLDAPDNTWRFTAKILEPKQELKRIKKTALFTFYREAVKNHEFNQLFLNNAVRGGTVGLVGEHTLNQDDVAAILKYSHKTVLKIISNGNLQVIFSRQEILYYKGTLD